MEPSAITSLTAHFTCGVMSDLMICKHTKDYGHTSHQMSLLRPGVIKQHKLKLQPIMGPDFSYQDSFVCQQKVDVLIVLGLTPE